MRLRAGAQLRCGEILDGIFLGREAQDWVCRAWVTRGLFTDRRSDRRGPRAGSSPHEMMRSIGSAIGRSPDVTGHHGQEGADARGDRITHSAPARLWDLWLGTRRSNQQRSNSPSSGPTPTRERPPASSPNWLLDLRWQRLPAFQQLGALVMRHLIGILNYCHEKAPFGKVEAINGNIRAMLRRGRGHRDHEYLLLKVQKATPTRRLRQPA
jgi:hypothetical protein